MSEGRPRKLGERKPLPGRDSHFAHGSLEQSGQLAFDFDKPKRGGVSFLRHGARRYAERQGMTYDDEGLDTIRADGPFQHRVAQSYDKSTPFDNDIRVKKAYEALRHETVKQYEYLTTPRHQGGLGLTVEVSDTDPYKDHREATHDVLTNRRLKVLSTKTTGSHPIFSDEENDKFRAVHDAFGHLASGRGFDRHGEEAAYHSHVQMFSPAARPAMASETRMQNSVLNYGKKEGFPEQKNLAAPAWVQKNRLPKKPRGSR